MVDTVPSRKFEFTVPRLKAISPPDGQTKATRTVDYADSKERGLLLRVSYAGSKTFVAKATGINGRRKKTLVRFSPDGTGDGITLADARLATKVFRGEYASGRDVMAEIRGEKENHSAAPTVNAIIAEYLELHVKSLKTARQVEAILIGSNRYRKTGEGHPTISDMIGRMKFRDVKRRDVQAMIDRIVKRGTPYMANRVLEITNHLFKWAIRREIDEAVEYNVADLIERQREAPCERWLTDNEISALWSKLDEVAVPDVALIYRLLIVTGQREGEVLGMRWSELDFEKGEWIIPAERTKSERTQLVPMSTLFRQFVAGRGRTSEWVFPTGTYRGKTSKSGRRSRSSFANGHREVVEAVGVDYFRFHDLRRTVTTHLGELGFSEFVAGRVLNHAQAGITGRHYNFYGYRDEKLQALEAWSYKLMWLTGQTPPGDLIARLDKWGFGDKWAERPWNLAQWHQSGEKIVPLSR